MSEKQILLLDEKTMARTLRRLAHEITEKNDDLENVILIGILRRGASLARIIADEIEQIEGQRISVEVLDITFYRDDLQQISKSPTVIERPFSADINGKNLIVVDDVIFTGRTVRAAIDSLMDKGRPRRIQLAVLVDRGHRELPIRPDYVGKNVPTSLDEKITVHCTEYDGEQNVMLSDR